MMALSLASAVAAVSTFITKMETITIFVVSAELELTGRRTMIMFKAFKNAAVCVFLAAIMLTGCSDTDTYGNETVDEYKYFYRLGNSPIVYERDTKIMYYMIYNGYMSPYYNEHGQMCYYVDGQIIPIEEVLIDAD